MSKLYPFSSFTVENFNASDGQKRMEQIVWIEEIQRKGYFCIFQIF